MKRSCSFYFLLVLFISYNSFGQFLKGTVVSEDNKPLNASVLFKEFTDSLDTKEFALARNGKFQKELKQDYDKLLIEVRADGYNEQTLTIQNPKKNKTYIKDFVLMEIKKNKLEEVVVFGKKRRFEVKKDTIVFDTDRYSDGSERKIEDVISKLPGVEVNEQTGKIKYKGKSVETVTLDGDNLFGFNYTLGTKNINVDMVEQIEAIDNYSENPLLKGIEKGGKTSLNLKLKKNKIDFSGNVDLDSGFFNDGAQAFDMSSNILGVTKNYKSFATLSYNNIGINQTPFDYFGFSFSAGQQKEQNYFAEKIIPETLFSNLLKNRRANINNQYFGNYNAIFKINKKLKIRSNLYFLQDRITSDQLSQNNYQINDNDTFTTTDDTFITKKPQQYRGDVEVKYNTSKSSLLEYNLRLRQENIETPTTIIQNQTDEFSTFLSTEDFYIKQDLLWTKKLTNKKALQVSFLHSFNKLPQTFTITPSKFNTNPISDTQKSEYKKTYLEGKATYLGSGKRDKYSFTLGANVNYSPYFSRLFNSEENISINNFDYSKKNMFNSGIYTFNEGKWKISPSYRIRILGQTLEEKVDDFKNIQNDIVFEPALNLKYELNTISFLSANLGYDQRTNSEQYFFLNQVLINNRATISNLPSIKLQEKQSYSIFYYNNDLYEQFELNANISYQKSKGSYFSDRDINQNTTQIKYFFLPQDQSNWNMNMKISKYITFIKSTLRLKSSYSLRNYRNIVNDSDLRQNQNQFLNSSFFWKTALDIPVNFENKFTYKYSISKNEDQSAFTNKSWQNNSKIILNPNEKWFFILSSDFYLPNTNKSNEQFYFIDASLKHKPENKKWEASLELRNITNENNFEQVQTSDISRTLFRSNLLPRYFMVNLTYKL